MEGIVVCVGVGITASGYWQTTFRTQESDGQPVQDIVVKMGPVRGARDHTSPWAGDKTGDCYTVGKYYRLQIDLKPFEFTQL